MLKDSLNWLNFLQGVLLLSGAQRTPRQRQRFLLSSLDNIKWDPHQPITKFNGSDKFWWSSKWTFRFPHKYTQVMSYIFYTRVDMWAYTGKLIVQFFPHETDIAHLLINLIFHAANFLVSTQWRIQKFFGESANSKDEGANLFVATFSLKTAWKLNKWDREGNASISPTCLDPHLGY